MAGHKHDDGTGRPDRGHQGDEEKRDHDEKRRTVDEGTPQPKGFTSPGEGMDDEPVEPRQSKDYP